MSDRGWDERRRDSERLWRQIRERIEALGRDAAAGAPGEDLPALWHRRAVELAEAPDRDREVGEVHTLVVLRLGSDRYAVAITAVREIQRVGTITPVGTAPAFVRGVVNLRGAILAVLDLRVFFGLEAGPVAEASRLLIVEGAGMVLGLLVDEVAEIVDLPATEVKPPLASSKGVAEDYITGIAALGAQMVVLLDLEKVLRNPRIVVDEVV